MKILQSILLSAACLCVVSPITVVFAETHLPEVAGFDPSSNLLPENLLRVHIRFTEPMREGEFSNYIEVVHTDTGKQIPLVFFDSFYELWNQDRTRLTLLVDPGRVKTGLTANADLGRAFIAGEQYSVNVKPGWLSMGGVAVEKEYSHGFIAIPQMRTAINPDNWNVYTQGKSIHIDFHRVIDIHSLNAHMILVDAEGETITGQWWGLNNSKTAQFTYSGNNQPDRIVVRNRFEDAAGNTVVAAFDHAIGASPSVKEKQTTVIKLD